MSPRSRSLLLGGAAAALVLGGAALAAAPDLALCFGLRSTRLVLGDTSHVELREPVAAGTRVVARARGGAIALSVSDPAGAELVALRTTPARVEFHAPSDGTYLWTVDGRSEGGGTMDLVILRLPGAFAALCDWGPLLAALGLVPAGMALRQRRARGSLSGS